MNKITSIPQADGGTRNVYAQDERHALRARKILRNDPAMIDHLDGVDGIEITVRDSHPEPPIGMAGDAPIDGDGIVARADRCPEE